MKKKNSASFVVFTSAQWLCPHLLPFQPATAWTLGPQPGGNSVPAGTGSAADSKGSYN